MRPMFFERPVVAARPANTSEVGVHARPIGKGISSGTVCAPRVSSTCVHLTDKSAYDICRGIRVRLTCVSRLRIGIETYSGAWCWPATHVFCFCWCCYSLRARSGFVTSAIPPHLVNTKHGRRTDIR